MKKTLLVNTRSVGYSTVPETRVKLVYHFETVNVEVFNLGLIDVPVIDLFHVENLNELSLDAKNDGLNMEPKDVKGHLVRLVKDYLIEGDTAHPQGGLLNGTQLIYEEGSDIHKNIIRLNGFCKAKTKTGVAS